MNETAEERSEETKEETKEETLGFAVSCEWDKIVL